jgi:NADPH-dependent 2,4-dienoyl-CoA reductase/sulfur reductase-like enzyme/nitrite reductase/ring-hydroxylating ferredoxin subunit
LSEGESKLTGPDLAEGIPAKSLAHDQMLVGHAHGKAVLLARVGPEIFAVSPHCTHYHGPLADGLIVGETVRCPWHHACFDLRTGEAVRAPALSPITCWEVVEDSGVIRVGQKRGQPRTRTRIEPSAKTDRIVIVGGGAAGFAAAEMLRRVGYGNSLVMLSSDAALPYDRPNLSKDYLAGTIPFDYMPLRDESFYEENGIEIQLGKNVVELDLRAHEVLLSGGERIAYDRLLLATGAEPVRLTIPGAEQPHIHTLRSLADSEAIIQAAKAAKRAVVIGASFIGLEVAASLRGRKLEVHVVAPDKRPMERILGPDMGAFIRALHEEHGVTFHLETRPKAIDRAVHLENGQTVDADLVVVGIGVRPRTGLAENAGLTTDRGVAVDQYLETSAPGVYAAGDIARWPDPHSGEKLRIEHWVVAERQGQTAALNMLGEREAFVQVPFFWSQHYDVPINYVGHAGSWDEIAIEGDIMKKDCVLRFKQNGRLVAAASIFRDLESLQAEVAMEHEIAA